MNDPAETPANPFLGPRPFTSADRDRFFERAELVREVALLVLAQRLVIVHGASGAGKTSLMQAGVLPDLERRGAAVLRTFEVAGMAARERSGEEPAGAYWQDYLDRHLPAGDDRGVDDGDLTDDDSGPLRPEEFVAWAFARQRRREPSEAQEATRVLVLDQVQDLFLDRTPAGEAERATFTSTLLRVMADDRRLHLVLVVDDAYLSAARALAAQMQLTTPPVLINVPPFTQEQAREVIARTAALDGASIDVDGVVRAAAAATRTSEAEQEDESRLVDPILLQTVAWGAYEDASTPDAAPTASGRSRLLTPVDLLRGRRRGGDQAAGPLRELYSDVVERADEASDWNEQRIRRWSLDALVSPLGTRALVALPAPDSPEASLLATFEAGAFVERTQDGSAPALRLTHDRLVPELVASNRGFSAMRPLLVLLRVVAVAAALLLLSWMISGYLQFKRAEDALARVEELERQLSLTATPSPTPFTPSPTPTTVPLATPQAACQPTEGHAGDSVQCSAGYPADAKTFTWRDDGVSVGTGEPLMVHEPAIGSHGLTLEVCRDEGECAISEPVEVTIQSRLAVAPTSLELVTSVDLEITNEASRPTVWKAEAPAALNIEPSSGVLGGDETMTITLSATASTPADGADIDITFEAGPSETSMVAAGTVSVVVSAHTPPRLSLPGDLLHTELEAGAGSLVTYTASAIDAVDGNLPVTCLPPSGTVFPVGSTVVSCRTVNSWGLSADGSFGVVVLEAPGPPPISATCALFVDGALQEATCTAVVEFWESRGKPELADPYRAAAAAEAEATAGS